MKPHNDVSVVLPTFNRRELLLRAIQSVVDQTVSVREIIIVDDGSTDGTEDAVAQLHRHDIRYIKQANRGVSSARNAGLRVAGGRYIAFLDSDDEWYPEKTAEQVEWLEAHEDFGMVLCDVQQIDDNFKPIGLLRRRDFLPEDGYVLRWVLEHPMLAPASAMMRRAVYEDIGGFREDLRTAEDLDFHLRVAAKWKIGIVSRPLVCATRGRGGLSELPQTYVDYLRVVEDAVSSAAADVSLVDRRRALSTAYCRASRGSLYETSYIEAGRHGVRAFREAPDFSHIKAAMSLAPLAVRQLLSNLLPTGRYRRS